MGKQQIPYLIPPPQSLKFFILIGFHWNLTLKSRMKKHVVFKKLSAEKEQKKKAFGHLMCSGPKA